MAEEAPDNQDIQKNKSKLPIKTLIIILAVFLLEAGAISFFFVMKGGPKPAEGSDPIADTEDAVKNNMAEVELATDFQVVNYMQGRSRIIVTLEVAATTDLDKKEMLQTKVTDRAKEILNVIRIIVSSAQPDEIKDPKLEVIRREIKSGVSGIVGEDLLKEILVPVWAPYSDD